MSYITKLRRRLAEVTFRAMPQPDFTLRDELALREAEFRNEYRNGMMDRYPDWTPVTDNEMELWLSEVRQVPSPQPNDIGYWLLARLDYLRGCMLNIGYNVRYILTGYDPFMDSYHEDYDVMGGYNGRNK